MIKKPLLVFAWALSGLFLIVSPAVRADDQAASPVVAEAAAQSSDSESSKTVSVEVGQPTATTIATTTEPTTESSGESADSETTPESEQAVSQTPGNVTVDFKDADIQNVLRILSFKSGVNIVAGKDVTGTVTIRLVDVPWEKALDVVLKTYGYTYERDGSIIRVTTLDALKKEDLSTEVFVLNYASSAEVESAIKDILSERGKVRADARSNSIIVTDMPTVLAQTKKVIERLDRGPAQVQINAKIIETTLGTADRLGIQWSTRVGVTGSSRPTTLPWGATQRTFMYRFLPIGQEEIETATDGGAVTADNAQFPSGRLSGESIQPSFPLTVPGDFQFGTIDFSQFQMVLEAIQNKTNSKVLSEPHVMVMNNQEARINVGETIAIPRFERNATTGRMEITGYTDRNLGITLTVTPQINNANEIVLSLNPAITGLIAFEPLSADIVAPRYSTREARTQIRIKDGQTVAIGGLISDNTREITSKIPILGDLPIAGKLFKFKNKTGDKTDLLFFMTVNIITDKTPAPQGHKL